MTGDGYVGVLDALDVLLHLGSHQRRFDVNGDGIVNLRDLLIVLDQLGTHCHRIG